MEEKLRHTLETVSEHANNVLSSFSWRKQKEIKAHVSRARVRERFALLVNCRPPPYTAQVSCLPQLKALADREKWEEFEHFHFYFQSRVSSLQGTETVLRHFISLSAVVQQQQLDIMAELNASRFRHRSSQVQQVRFESDAYDAFFCCTLHMQIVQAHSGVSNCECKSLLLS